MKKLYIDVPTKWKTRELRQKYTADPVGMGRKARQHTIVQYSVQARLSVYSDWISCMYLAELHRSPFCGLIYIHLFKQLLHLCSTHIYNPVLYSTREKEYLLYKKK